MAEIIVSDELRNKLDEFSDITATSNDGKKLMLPFLKVFQEFLTSLENKFDGFKKEMIEINKEKDEDIALLKNEVNRQKNRISTLEDQLDEKDQYVRRESVIFSGESLPVYSEQEDCVTHVINLISRKLGTEEFEIFPTDISIAHRMGPKPTSGTDRRSIIARFTRRSLKYKILNKSRNVKAENFYVSESLTKRRQTITKVIRKAKKDFPMKYPVTQRLMAPSTCG